MPVVLHPELKCCIPFTPLFMTLHTAGQRGRSFCSHNYYVLPFVMCNKQEKAV